MEPTIYDNIALYTVELLLIAGFIGVVSYIIYAVTEYRKNSKLGSVDFGGDMQHAITENAVEEMVTSTVRDSNGYIQNNNEFIGEYIKKVLMLTAKEAEIPFILQAQMMGYYVITTGNAPQQVGHKYADEYVPFDYSDFEGITKMAKEHNIDAVMRGCSDNCAFTAAYICDHLGLKGHDTFEVTEIDRKSVV